jgi:hypothetical protein
MRIRSSLKLVLAFAVLAYGASPAGAQPGSLAGQVTFQQGPSLTSNEQLAESATQIARMEQVSGAVGKMLETARAQRQVPKVLCLDDKLGRINVAVRSARERRSAVESAVRRNDAAGASHEYGMLTTFRQRVDELRAQANQCIGDDGATFNGTTSTTVTVNPQVAGGANGADVSQVPATALAGDLSLPFCASCVL